jgi:hypothetical protein
MIRIFTESLLLYDDSDQLRGIFTPSDKEWWVNMSIRCGIWRRSPGAVPFASEFCKMPVPKVSQGRLFSMWPIRFVSRYNG